jgi:predicted AAA+ superfamily ATPase
LEQLPSFGVGRIQSIYMYPFSFQEFMSACGEELLWNEVCKASPQEPINSVFHESCVALLKKFLILGGMPAVVSEYVQNRDTLAAQKELENLVNSLKSDFSKYKQRIPELRVSTVFEAVIRQSGGKFNYAKVESLHYRQVKESLELLQKAGLVIPVVSVAANGVPLGAEANYKKQKMILLDTGIFQNILGLEIADLLLSNDFEVVNKGAIAEQFVGLELIKSASYYRSQNLYFWTREKINSSAEVDYLIQKGEEIIPIEVKSGKSGKMQSMHLFLQEKKSKYGIRTSLENFGQYDKIKVYPLYAIGNILR